MLTTVFRLYRRLRREGLPRLTPMEIWQRRWFAIDQTQRAGTLAQIQCIVRKRARIARESRTGGGLDRRTASRTLSP